MNVIYPLTQCLDCQAISKKQKDHEPTPDTTWPQLYAAANQQTGDFMSMVASGSDMCVYFMYEMFTWAVRGEKGMGIYIIAYCIFFYELCTWMTI